MTEREAKTDPAPPLTAEETRHLLEDILSASERAAKASEACAAELVTLKEIIARDLSPMAGVRRDIGDKFEDHFNAIGVLKLKVAELEVWRDEFERLRAANGG